MSKSGNYLYEFGPFCLDPGKRLLLRDGELLPLRPKAFDTLLVLFQFYFFWFVCTRCEPNVSG